MRHISLVSLPALAGRAALLCAARLAVVMLSMLLPFGSQAQTWDWTTMATQKQNYGPTFSQKTATDAAGNVYIAGYFNNVVSFGTTTLVSQGGDDIFVAKMNSSGVWQWAMRAGGPDLNDGALDLAVDAGSNVYITGYFQGTATFGATSLTAPTSPSFNDPIDAFVAKLDAAGSWQWVVQGGTNEPDYGRGIAVDGAGNVYVTGEYGPSTATFGAFSFTNPGFGHDAFMAKLSPGGVWQWVTPGNSTSSFYMSDAAFDASGALFVSGNYNGGPTSIDGVTLTSASSANVFVARVNPATGAVQWTASGGNGTTAYGYSLATNGLGDTYLTGTFTSTALTLGATTLVPVGGYDGFLAKVSSAGAWLWATRFGGPTDDVGRGVAVDAAGNVYVTGYFNSTGANFGPFTLTTTGSSDIFVARLTAGGGWTWAVKGGGTGTDSGSGVAIEPSGNVLVTGGLNSNPVTLGSLTFAVGPSVAFVGRLNNLGTWQLAATNEGVYWQVFERVRTDAAGNTYVAGYFTGRLAFGATTLIADGSSNVFIAKLSPTGTWLWAVKGGGYSFDYLLDMDVDATGNVYVAGAYEDRPTDFGATTLPNSGRWDGFVAKLSSGGSWVWAQGIHGSDLDFADVIATDATGHVFVAGDFYSPTVTLGATTLTNTGGNDQFVARLNATTGTWDWVHQTTGTGSGLIQGMATDAAGDVYLAGKFAGTESFGATPLTSVSFGYDAFVAKISGGGSWQWAIRAGTTGDETATVATGPGGALYAAGTFSGSSLTLGATTLTSADTSSVFRGDVFVARLNPATGAWQWATRGGGLGQDYVGGLTADAAGNVYVAGTFNGNATFGPSALTSAGGSDAFAARLSSAGTWLWARGGGGSQDEFSRSVAADANGHVVLSGAFESTSATFGPTTLTQPFSSKNHTGTGFVSRLNGGPPPFTWTGEANTSWADPGNWTFSLVPGATDDATIPGAVPNNPTISANQSVHDLTLAGGSLTLASGTFTVNGNWQNDGTFSQSGGEVSLAGASPQTVGGSATTTFQDLTIGASGASLSAPVNIWHTLRLTGNLASGGNLTLLSDAVGTGMVVNSGGVVTGSATAQRYIDPAFNSGLGYRHFSSPVQATTFADLATAGFTPVVNPLYNGIPRPYIPPSSFPNVLGFNEQRAPASSTFSYGYYSPNALTDVMTPGRGWSVYYPATSKSDFVGTLTNGNVTLTNLTRTGAFLGSTQKSGWHLLGNPYPAPIDWDLVTIPAGMSPSVSVWHSTGVSDAGAYTVYTNGVGPLGADLIAMGQGFFARVTGVGPVTFTFTNASRLTSYANPAMYRGSAPAETRPVLSLRLRAEGATTGQSDETFLYFQEGATADFDEAFDGARPGRNVGVPTLATLAGAEELGVNGLPESLLTRGGTVPLLVVLPAAGTYELAVGQLTNLAGRDVALLDRLTNTRYDLMTAPTVRFMAAQAGPVSGRFAVGFGQAATAGSPMAFAVWPNPARDAVRVSEVTPGATLTLLDALGRVVSTTTADATGAAQLVLAKLPAGVYTVRCADQTQRLVVE